MHPRGKFTLCTLGQCNNCAIVHFHRLVPDLVHVERMRCAGTLILLLPAIAVAELSMQVFPNGAWGGVPVANTTIARLDNTTLDGATGVGAGDIFSVEIRGTLTPPPGRVQLSCAITNGNAFVWLDDHVVCQAGNAKEVWGSYYTDASVLPWEATVERNDETKPLFLRATFAHPKPTAGAPSIELRWAPLPPNPAPSPAALNLTYLGCYVDLQHGARDLPVNAGDLSHDTPEACAAECAAHGAYAFIGVQDGTNCFCGGAFGSQGSAPEQECNMPCAGNASIACGAADRNSIYATGIPPPPAPAPSVTVPASAFSAIVPAPQVTRLALQRDLLHGRWATWAKGSLTAHALLPHGIMVKLGVCAADGACDEDATKGMVDADTVRLGAHAYDHSYTQLYFQGHAGCNVSIETSQVGGTAGADWVALISPVDGCEGASAVAVVQFTDNLTSMCAAWRRYGVVASTASNANNGSASLTATPDGHGLSAVTVWPAGAPGGANADVEAPHFMTRGLGGGGAVAFSTGSTPRDVTTVARIISAARDAEHARYAAYGDLAEAKKMSQAGMMWNVIYSLEIPGTFAPVSRGWGRPWVIFDWDNIFGAYQLSLDAKELAYSQLVAVVKTKTANGMVPNFWQPQQISYDRTEPPIGAKVLHEMFGKYGDKWMAELLFDDLFDWTQWFMRRRRERGTGGNLIVLGSDNVGSITTDTPSMQAARYESGLDNSPMYDGDFFAYNETTRTGHMLLWDVGMTSMVAMEIRALADLALTAFSPPRTDVHAVLSSQLAELSAAVQENLWSEDLGIFVNKFSQNGSFYPRISPTSFYPMLAGISTDVQAATMVTRWLTNASRFCVAPNGDSEGNSQACFWGLPSISADDPAFPPLGYWRGFVWGPMAQLTYWSLQQYGHVPVVAQARAALAKQMTAMGMAQWHAHHHVCENYNPGFVANNKGADCTGDHFYHWGGLTGFVSLLEAGHYAYM